MMVIHIEIALVRTRSLNASCTGLVVCPMTLESDILHSAGRLWIFSNILLLFLNFGADSLLK